MTFTSYEFLLFYLLVFALYWVIREHHWQNIVLLAASYYFYGVLHAWYAILLGISTLLDFFLTRAIASNPNRKQIFFNTSLFLNLSVLAFFKYFNFFAADVLNFLHTFGIYTDPLLLNILLPAGLSFFTLKKLSYMFDVSRGTLQPADSFIDYALYVAFFPQIIAGPIDRPQQLLPQITSVRIWKIEHLQEAWPLLVMGFFKKLVIANSIQVLTDRVFGLAQPSGFLLLSGTLAYTLLIFADFSAYTNLSRGFARLLGFNTTENFRQPYLSLTPTDFWNRWHITLSNWLRDYVFFPIRRTLLRFKLNETIALTLPPLITMFISGLWHGAGLNFIVWGIYYGILIAIYQLLGIRGDWKPRTKLGTLAAWSIMFLWIVLGWAIFRARSLSWLGAIIFQTPFLPPYNEFILGIIILTATLVYTLPLLIKHLIDRFAPSGWGNAVYYAIAVIWTIFYINSSNSDFIYVQF